MATTTNYGWDTPDDTDLVKDGAAAIRTLGSSVDTTTKALNPSTTLGDIEYRSATANTNTRLPIGTSGQLLSVNGSGVPAWVSAPSSIPANEWAATNASETTSSTTYTDLTTVTSVTLTTGTKALVIVNAQHEGNGASQGGFVGFAVSGATTIAASDDNAIYKEFAASTKLGMSKSFVVTLTAGSNTFTLKYRGLQASQGSWSRRGIFVMNLA
jgi:hypothetical protein